MTIKVRYENLKATLKGLDKELERKDLTRKERLGLTKASIHVTSALLDLEMMTNFEILKG